MPVSARVALAAVLLVVVCSLGVAAPLFTGSEAVPKDAVVLFDGKDLSQWTSADGDEPAPWKVENGYAEARDGDIHSKRLFGDCQLHAEFWLPKIDSSEHGRVNSGVFFNDFTYEIQILDSYGVEKPGVGDCGAIYSITPPMVNASRPVEQWQSFDIVFRAPRFDATGKKVENARATVLLNGVLVHNNGEFTSATPDHNAPEPAGPGPIRLQDHGFPVRFRNVWVRPLS